MKPVLEANETNFKSEVLDPTQPVLVDFWAGRCGPGHTLAPVLEEIAREKAGRVKIVRVNVDQNPALARHYHVQSTPTLIYFVNGLVYDHLVGLAEKKEIVAKLEGMIAV